MQEKLIYPPTVWSYNWDQLPNGESDPRHGIECREIPYFAYEEMKKVTLPHTRVAFASAPGTGRVEYLITRVDETGAYGYEVSNTVRELQAWEVR